VIGCLSEERYKRFDHGVEPNHARLRMVWRRAWRRGDDISTVLPSEGGIHRVGNPTESKAISVYLYGPRIGELDDRDYDSSSAYVCDRWEA
jgi:hypothetical protein